MHSDADSHITRTMQRLDDTINVHDSNTTLASNDDGRHEPYYLVIDPNRTSHGVSLTLKYSEHTASAHLLMLRNGV